jgi:hypothetical protein
MACSPVPHESGTIVLQQLWSRRSHKAHDVSAQGLQGWCVSCTVARRALYLALRYVAISILTFRSTVRMSCRGRNNRHHSLLTWPSDSMQSSGGHSAQLSGCPAAGETINTASSGQHSEQEGGSWSSLAPVLVLGATRSSQRLKAPAVLRLFCPCLAAGYSTHKQLLQQRKRA